VAVSREADSALIIRSDGAVCAPAFYGRPYRRGRALVIFVERLRGLLANLRDGVWLIY
jgi:hypothetical protein